MNPETRARRPEPPRPRDGSPLTPAETAFFALGLAIAGLAVAASLTVGLEIHRLYADVRLLAGEGEEPPSAEDAAPPTDPATRVDAYLEARAAAREALRGPAPSAGGLTGIVSRVHRRATARRTFLEVLGQRGLDLEAARAIHHVIRGEAAPSDPSLTRAVEERADRIEALADPVLDEVIARDDPAEIIRPAD